MMYQATMGASTGWHLWKRLLVENIGRIDMLLVWCHIRKLVGQWNFLLSTRLSRYREWVVSISILNFYKLSRHLYLCLVGLCCRFSLLNGWRHLRWGQVSFHPFGNTLHASLSFWLLSLLSWGFAFLNYADTLPSKVRSHRLTLI